MKVGFYGRSFQLFRSLMRLFTGRHHVANLRSSNRPVVYISRHQYFYGPLMAMIWFPEPLHLWALSVFCNQESCYRQITKYPLTERMKLPLLLARMIAKPISYPISALVRSAKVIPVYRGSRKIISTFKESAELLQKGESIVIFPDMDYSNRSDEIKEMYVGFLNLERYYYRLTGQHICFRALYADKTTKTIIVGEDLSFQDGEDFQTEKERMATAIRNSLNELARVSDVQKKEQAE